MQCVSSGAMSASVSGVHGRPMCVPRLAPSRYVREPASMIGRTSRSSGDGFLTGFVLGGFVFGTLGFLLAPQISRALLDEDQRLRMPRFLEEEKDPAQTKQDLIDRINRLNASIDEVSTKLKEPEVVK